MASSPSALWAEMQDKTRGFWNKGCERAIRWDDPALAIAWPLQGLTVQVSEKDGLAPSLAQAEQAGDLFG